MAKNTRQKATTRCKN